MEMTYAEQVYKGVEEFSSELDYSQNEVAIILAAGHGKRIKSQTSKMLHTIWGIPTVERVYNACNNEFSSMNTVLVVGIKALDVMAVFGKREKVGFAYQEFQNGTGHAVQVGLEKVDKDRFSGIVYVFPGDMGLIDNETVSMFRKSFKDSGADMMVLTGLYEGNIEANQYGRIVRVKSTDIEGNPSGNDENKVIEIIEHKDILALGDDTPYVVEYNGRKYSYTKKEMIENREYNSGVYAFDHKKLIEQVDNISSNNAQNEIYITDLIALFNKAHYSVGAVSPKNEYVVMGFNDKSVLKEMKQLYKKIVYNKLKNIIEIQDPDDFFIDEGVVRDLINLDKEGIPLDIKLGKGAHIGKGVKLNYGVEIKKNVYIKGNVVFGKNVKIAENCHLSTFPHQTFTLGDGVSISWGDIIKGNITIGENSVIESSVNMTGSDDHPLVLGKNVLVKGTSYVFGSVIEDDVHIEHSVIIRKRIIRQIRKDGTVQKVMFYLPMPSGLDVIEEL
ncbi:bifunctional UDP-N-acetylglucosamine diphosphorylase/glucosamine-1-phosphate N-acetyltransferase GlmU [Ignavibacteriales bacterium]